MRVGKFRIKKRRFIILTTCAILLITAVLITLFRPHNQGLYKVTYLPSLGGEFTRPFSINDRGQIAGYSQLKNGNDRLVLWEHEKGIQDLGPVSGFLGYINNSGQIAATMPDTNGNERAFIWDPNHTRFILPTLGGEKARALGINNHGQVIGYSETSSGEQHAYVWDSVNGIRDLTPSSTTKMGASSINDTGQIIIYDFDGNVLRLVDANEGLTSISPTLPSNHFSRINNNGFTAGRVRIGRDKFDIGILNPDSGKMRLLGLNMDLNIELFINDVNQVFFARGSSRREFRLFGQTLFTYVSRKNYLHDPNLGLISLNEYVALGRKEVFNIIDINNKGCIIGIVDSIDDPCWHGVLLEPIPKKWKKYKR